MEDLIETLTSFPSPSQSLPSKELLRADQTIEPISMSVRMKEETGDKKNSSTFLFSGQLSVLF